MTVVHMSAPRESLPPIRLLFAGQNLFHNMPPEQLSPISPRTDQASIGSAIQSLDVSAFNRDAIYADLTAMHLPREEISSDLATLRLARSASISTSTSASDDDQPMTSSSPPKRPSRTAPTRVTKKRTQDAKSKESQKIRNRKGRRCENAGLRLLESVVLGLASSAGAGANKQITSNSQKSGLTYTKCSILEMATRMLLVCKPLLERVREADPELARALEGEVDRIMLDQGRN